MFIKIRSLETDPYGGRLPDAEGYVNSDLITHWLADEAWRVTVLMTVDELAALIPQRM